MRPACSQPPDDWVHVRLYNPDNTQQLALSTTISILENEATVHHITVTPDTMRAAFLDRRMPEGAIIVYVPKALYTVLLEDTYLFYEDGTMAEEILLKIQQCSDKGIPLTPDAEEISTSHSRAADISAARERKNREQQLRTVKIRYDLPTTCLNATLANGRMKPIVDGLVSQAQAVSSRARISPAQPRDEFHRLRNSLDIYIEFPSQLDHNRASYSGVKFFAPGRGMAPLNGYIMPQKLASLSIQQCCFRSPEVCGKDRNEGFATCRQRTRFTKSCGHDYRALPNSRTANEKQSTKSSKLSANRPPLNMNGRGPACAPHIWQDRCAAPPIPHPYVLTLRHVPVQCPITGCPNRHQGPSYTRTLLCTSATGGACPATPCPYFHAPAP